MKNYECFRSFRYQIYIYIYIQVIRVINCISEIPEPVLDLVILDLLLLRILKYSLNCENSVHFFELIFNFNTPNRSNRLEDREAQAFNDRLHNAIQDCISHLFLLEERKRSKLSWYRVFWNIGGGREVAGKKEDICTGPIGPIAAILGEYSKFITYWFTFRDARSYCLTFGDNFLFIKYWYISIMLVRCTAW